MYQCWHLLALVCFMFLKIINISLLTQGGYAMLRKLMVVTFCPTLGIVLFRIDKYVITFTMTAQQNHLNRSSAPLLKIS